MRTALIRLMFLPTLGWNLFLSRVLGVRRWYDRIDEHVVLGALPFASTASELHGLGVRAVVNTCAEYGGPTKAYEQLGIEQLRIPTLDFTPPTLESVQRAVGFMREHAARGSSIYVHCKAGRGRSATVVLCWLIAEMGLTPEAGQRFLEERRSHVNRGLHQRAVVRAFAEKKRRTP